MVMEVDATIGTSLFLKSWETLLGQTDLAYSQLHCIVSFSSSPDASCGKVESTDLRVTESRVGIFLVSLQCFDPGQVTKLSELLLP